MIDVPTDKWTAVKIIGGSIAFTAFVGYIAIEGGSGIFYGLSLVGLLGAAFGILMYVEKPSFEVSIVSASGESRYLLSKDRERIAEIVSAIKQAIVGNSASEREVSGPRQSAGSSPVIEGVQRQWNAQKTTNSSAGTGASTLSQEIERLSALHAQKKLTDLEFEAAKKKLLGL